MEQQNSELIISLGFQAKSALDNVAERYPDRHFVLFDLPAEARENVSSVIFAQHEGAFVAGALAAMMTDKKSALTKWLFFTR
ncbi:MAG: BMP family ABC transporter substrate-binding protein [bacterium]|nr:BMP family ABC transporter substrate-binding protein [bacterium]